MKTYSEFRPSQFDTKGLGLEDRQDWLVASVAQNRDSDVLTRCNFAVARDMLITASGDDESDVEVHRFGHWANGWFEIILVRPGSAAAGAAEEIEAALADYPVLDENKFSDMCQEEANEIWKQFRLKDRITYYEKHQSDFEFRCFSDMLGCMRGKYFAGDAMDLASIG